MITSDDAIEIARKAVQGKVNIQNSAPAKTELREGRYVVTFPRINPPGVRGPDYYARVTINAETGEVIEILGGG